MPLRCPFYDLVLHFLVQKMGDPISVIIGTIGLVETAWGIGKQSHRYFSKPKGANYSRKRFQEEILSLTNVLVQAETRFRDAEPRGLVPYCQSSLSADVISNCHKQLISINQEMQKHSSETAWPLHEEELQKHIDAFQHINNIFSSFLAANVLNTTTTTHSHVEEMIQEKEREKLIFWLDISECTHRSLPSPHPGTGRWLLDCDTYRTWRDGAPSLLWCYGAPGIGKSSLAYCVLLFCWIFWMLTIAVLPSFKTSQYRVTQERLALLTSSVTSLPEHSKAPTPF